MVVVRCSARPERFISLLLLFLSFLWGVKVATPIPRVRYVVGDPGTTHQLQRISKQRNGGQLQSFV